MGVALTAKVIDGRAVAARVRADVAAEVEAFVDEGGGPPALAMVLVGDDPASAVYVGGKQRACEEVGIAGFDYRLAAETSREEVVGHWKLEQDARDRVVGVEAL